ncbi:hypothetical protein Hanom_Chr01g00001111 [Helianthus anomalus]
MYIFVSLHVYTYLQADSLACFLSEYCCLKLSMVVELIKSMSLLATPTAFPVTQGIEKRKPC